MKTQMMRSLGMVAALLSGCLIQVDARASAGVVEAPSQPNTVEVRSDADEGARVENASGAEGQTVNEFTVGDAQAAAAASAEFGATLTRALFSSEEANVVLSPYSISAALHLTMLGAEGETLDAMRRGLAVSAIEAAEAHANLGALNNALTSEGQDGAPQVRIANRVWAEQTLEGFLRGDYREEAQAYYQAETGFVNFRDSTEAACQEVNAWVSEQTEGMIPRVLDAGSVGSDTTAVLTNAVYFLGDWAESFNASWTRPRPFYLLDGSTSEVPMMARTAWMRFEEQANRKVVSLPYVGGEWSLHIVLPNEGSFQQVGEELVQSGFDTQLGQRRVEVDLQMPRFRAEWMSSLTVQLREMGFAPAFDLDSSDFSAMFGGFGEGVSIKDVFHRAVIEVDERGTEAAAATAVVEVEESYDGSPDPLPMVVNRPFYFVLMHEPTSTPFFVGRVNEPEAVLRNGTEGDENSIDLRRRVREAGCSAGGQAPSGAYWAFLLPLGLMRRRRAA